MVSSGPTGCKKPCTDNTGAPTTSSHAAAGVSSTGRHGLEQLHHQHQHQQHQQQHTAAPAAAAAPPLQQSYSRSSSRQQLRQPPARCARHAPNTLSGRGGLLPQHTYHSSKWPGRGGYPGDETTCTCVLPRTSVLCRLLVAMTVLLVFVQAVSCGMFFCVTVPAVSHSRTSSFADYQNLVSDLTAPALSASQQGQPQQPLSAVPKLIPRVIHQTYRNGRLPTPAKSFMKTWAEVNGEEWQVRFYSDDAALTFVRREFPEYFEAYLNLPKDVERADFFRYMVVLRLGGAYADIDAECRQPLDSIIQPADTLLVGWDTEVGNTTLAAATGLARQRLIANWFFVAAAGHPVLRELCDHIARNAMSTFSGDSVRDTAERTGQGVWTDVVLRHALQHQAAKHDDPWKVRILPRVAFGVRPTGDGATLRPDTPGVVVLHHFMSSWQVSRRRRLIQALVRPLLSWSSRSPQVQGIAEPVAASNISHYPVSISFNPPFTLMTDLVGLGDTQAAADVSAVLTAHGTWQPGVAPHRKPAVVEALVGALAQHSRRSSNSPVGASEAAPSTAPVAGRAGAGVAASAGVADTSPVPAAEEAGGGAAAAAGVASSAAPAGAGSSSSSSPATSSSAALYSPAASPRTLRGGMLVDVGAGQGFFSLAAAARGHRVIAFEASPASLAALKAGIAYNGFGDLITVRSTPLGATPGVVCLQQADRLGCPGAAAAAKLAASQHRAATNASSSNSTSEQQRLREQQELQVAVGQMQLRQRRGYPWLADGAGLSPNHSCCTAPGSRLRLSDVLRNASDVAALRLSAHGHEGFILQGALDYLRRVHRPDVVYVEFWPAAMRAAGYAQPVALVQALYDLGYSDIAHAGRVCDARWQNATRGLNLQGAYSSAARAALRQPTWCKLRPEQFSVLVEAADPNAPESIMFLLGEPNSLHSSSSSKAQQQPPGSTSSISSSSSSLVPVGDSSSSHLAPGEQLRRAAAGQAVAVATAAMQHSQQTALPPSLALAGTTSNGASSSRAVD